MERCRDCIYFREQPLRCIVDGYNKILSVDDMPELCKKFCENW